MIRFAYSKRRIISDILRPIFYQNLSPLLVKGFDIRLDADALPALLETLQTRDLTLLASYEQCLTRIPSAAPELVNLPFTAYSLLRTQPCAEGKPRRPPCWTPKRQV